MLHWLSACILLESASLIIQGANNNDIVPYITATSPEAFSSHPCYDLLLWKRCLYATCDFHPPPRGDDMKVWNQNDFSQALAAFEDTERPFRAYIETSQYSQFVRDGSWAELKQRDIPYVLVVGSSDRSQSEVWSEHELVLADNNCVAIFAHNADVRHTKLHPLPLGMPYNDKRVLHNGTPKEMDRVVRQLATHLDSSQREMKVLLNFKTFTKPGVRGRARSDLEQGLPRHHWIDLPDGTPATTVWNITSSLNFVLCPTGNGDDTHRAWEVLSLGAIPLLLRRGIAMEHTYKEAGLPVVIVDSYSEVTYDKLLEWHHELLPVVRKLQEDPTPLLSRTYMNKIFAAGVSDRPLDGALGQVQQQLDNVLARMKAPGYDVQADEDVVRYVITEGGNIYADYDSWPEQLRLKRWEIEFEYRRQVDEPENKAMLVNLSCHLPERSLVVDSDSHVGDTGLTLAMELKAQGCPSHAHVLMVDPHPDKVAWIRKKIALEGVEASAVVSGIWSSNTRARITKTQAHAGAWRVQPDANGPLVLRRIADIMETEKPGYKMRVWHLDAEGSELHALQGLGSHRPDYIMMESRYDRGHKAADYVKEMGYRLQIAMNSVDNLYHLEA
eukprot:TRINITY_DN11723_c0_g6_i1.p1 TRINITY_DN11723_c0_g6~~TRINITY_DN11723_c0_g6_i1.p1  ORF type:complete len:613 (+),score=129.90 TRINITY_DN11723_c0_g6_i1:1923-3761(+)